MNVMRTISLAATVLLIPANTFFATRSLLLHRPVGYLIMSTIAATVCTVVTLGNILRNS